MKLLGIDYGEKRIGLAIAEDGVITPLMVTTADKIPQICRQEKIEQLVIGLPEGRIVPEVKKLKKQLEQTTGLPIEFQDETLTSQQALARMILVGKKKSVRQKKQDAYAAALILEDYLQKEK